MDQNTQIVLIVVGIVVGIALVLVLRGQGGKKKFEFTAQKGDLRISTSAESQSAPEPGVIPSAAPQPPAPRAPGKVTITNSESQRGKVTARTDEGGTIRIDKTKGRKGIEADASGAKSKESK